MNLHANACFLQNTVTKNSIIFYTLYNLVVRLKEVEIPPNEMK